MNEISQNRVQSGVVETKASMPLALSTQLTAHTIESGSTSAGLGPHAGKRGRERETHTYWEKGEPIPNFFKLFCWMTNFISDQKQAKNRGRDECEKEDHGGRSWMGTGWRPSQQSTAPTHIWIWLFQFIKKICFVLVYVYVRLDDLFCVMIVDVEFTILHYL